MCKCKLKYHQAMKRLLFFTLIYTISTSVFGVIRTDSSKSIIFEDMIGMDSDHDTNDVSMCTNWKTSSNVSNTINKAVVSISGISAGAEYPNALYFRNPCSGDAKVQIRQFEAGCVVDGTSTQILSSGGLSLLTSSFADYAFSDSCGNKMINTISGENVCSPRKTYVVLECLGAGTINAPGGVPPFGEFFYLDPLADGTDGVNKSDDVYFDKENNNGLYNIYTGDCGDPIIPERTSIYDAYFLTGDTGVSGNCNFSSVNGNGCREAIKTAIQTRRANNWEQDPGTAAHLNIYRPPQASGIDFTANDISGFNWGINGLGNFNNPIYSSESQCLAEQNKASYSPGSSPSPCGDNMVTVWRTTSANQTVRLPLVASFNYNFTIDWGDGSPVGVVTSYNDPDSTHIYSLPGDYTVTMSGIAEALNSKTNMGYRDHLIEVVNLGGLCWKDLSFAFFECNNLNSFSGGNTSDVTSMAEMFKRARKLTSLDVSSFNTSKVTDMRGMFSYINLLNSLDVTNFDTSNVTSFAYMFHSLKNVANIDLTNFTTTKLTNMRGMFTNADGVTSLDFSSFDTSLVTGQNMSHLFSGAKSLTSVDVSSFDTSNITTLEGMFSDTSITALDLSNFDTSNLITVNGLFFKSLSLMSLNTNGWDISSVGNIKGVFGRTSSYMVVYCDQGGSPGTGTFFGRTCN